MLLLLLLELLELALLCGAWMMPSISRASSNTKNKRKNTGVRLRLRREVLVLVRLVARLGIIDDRVVVVVGLLAISIGGPSGIVQLYFGLRIWS